MYGYFTCQRWINYNCIEVIFKIIINKSNQINKVIKKAITLNKGFSIGKIGNVESVNLENYLRGYAQPKGIELFVNAGIYIENSTDYKDWSEKILSAILNQDYILDWKLNDKTELKKIVTNVKKFKKFEGLEPFILKNKGWHYHLSDKKILTVSPFSSSIIKQAKLFEKIWPEAKLGSVSTITTPHSDEITNKKPQSWKIKLDNILSELSNTKFDVAIVGCGGLSLMICDEIKKMGKTAIHLGGATQILFGIRGKRWDIDFSKHQWYGTKYWIRPSASETPINKILVEKGAYW